MSDIPKDIRERAAELYAQLNMQTWGDEFGNYGLHEEAEAIIAKALHEERQRTTTVSGQKPT